MSAFSHFSPSQLEALANKLRIAMSRHTAEDWRTAYRLVRGRLGIVAKAQSELFNQADFAEWIKAGFSRDQALKIAAIQSECDSPAIALQALDLFQVTLAAMPEMKAAPITRRSAKPPVTKTTPPAQPAQPVPPHWKRMNGNFKPPFIGLIVAADGTIERRTIISMTTADAALWAAHAAGMNRIETRAGVVAELEQTGP